MLDTPICKLFNVSYPILLAPMAGVAGGELAGAVSNNGGFGLVGGGYGDPAWLKRQLSLLPKNSNFGVGFITWRLKDGPELLDLALSASPRAILLSFGDIGPYVETIKRSNALVIAQVQDLKTAKQAALAGADVIVAQGTEAGGHGGSRATMSLVPAVVDAIADVPVIAAGGIADGRGIAAALALGAAGVMMGSRFYASREALSHNTAKQKVIESTGDNTTRSSVFDVLRQYEWPKPYNLRTLENEVAIEFQDNMDHLARNKKTVIEKFERAVAEGDFDRAPVIVGEAAGLIHDIPSAELLIRELIVETLKAIEHLHTLINQ